MGDEKTQVELPDKAPPSTTVDKAEEPAKDAGLTRSPGPWPGRAPSAAGAGGPTLARAVDRVTQPRAAQAADRARAMSTLQHAVGNTRISRLANTASPTPGPLVQRQPAEGETRTRAEAQTAAETASSAPAFVTPSLLRAMTATVLAEAWEGQEADIRWVYYNRVMAAQGESGLRGSTAYRTKGPWYRVWAYVLGDTTYGKTPLPQKRAEFKGYPTVADFCTRNDFMRTGARKRAQAVAQLVAATFKGGEAKPSAGWTGQGNLDDFNNVSQPGSLYWKMARAYYWLQEGHKVTEVYVKVLPAGQHTQVIFNPQAIEQYFQHQRLPQTAPPYYPQGVKPTQPKAGKK